MENATAGISIRPSKNPRLTSGAAPLSFGSTAADHMFTCTYGNGAWQEPSIIPFQQLSLSPFTLALHYGQSVFEGMKAFRMEDGSIGIFRIDRHWERLNRSLHRMCMPPVPEALFRAALHELISLDRNWVPASPGSLYIRPLVFASEARLGVKVSDQYEFIIVCSPVPPLYPDPISVKVEKNFTRAASGGTGYAKCAGNYGGAFYPTQQAREEGFDQVIWTDESHQYFEESGTMNLMFVIGGRLVTPPLSDTILDGVTRRSLIQLAMDAGIAVEERPVHVEEVREALTAGSLTEAFGAGTAAVVAPICRIGIDGISYSLPPYTAESISEKLRVEFEAIRTGRLADRHGWMEKAGR
ncbi:MAG TPA: branched-chain amino acid aminotransferase [Flavisolibacter sp.]|nr:branched-chain amino acid aminotransferase [Flavisolibacter sp.]